ncbi:MAG: sugar phosphate isomerase/epimerase [Fuerstiella sp.]|nr:sugar phosphate isomerase/epimerase [Fuerstiella sp.]
MSLRLAVTAADFGTPLRRAILRAGRAQVPGIRLNARHEILAENISSSGLRQLLQYVQENRMEVAGLSCPTRHSLADQEYLEERISLIRSVMDLALPLKTSKVLVPCGLIPDPSPEPTAEEPDDAGVGPMADPFSLTTSSAETSKPVTRTDQFSTLCQVASDLAGYGNHVGCTLTLQLANYDVSLIERLMAAVVTGPLQITFDPAVAVFTGAPVVDTYRRVYQSVGDVRARDGRRNSDYSGTETAVGDGIVNWEELLPTLVEADYTDWVCVERTCGDHRESDVLNGVSRVKSLLPHPDEG